MKEAVDALYGFTVDLSKPQRPISPNNNNKEPRKKPTTEICGSNTISPPPPALTPPDAHRYTVYTGIIDLSRGATTVNESRPPFPLSLILFCLFLV